MNNIDQVFAERTYYSFNKKPIDKNIIQDIYNVMKLGPTSVNSCPLRIYFVESESQREKLYNCLMPSNIIKSKSASLIAIFAYDLKFYELMPKLFPHEKYMQEYFLSSPKAALECAIRNSGLQAAYFMMIARSRGVDCGPMSGFDAEALEAAFMKDTNFKVNFMCNLGYRDGPCIYPKLPRLDFNEACKFL